MNLEKAMVNLKRRGFDVCYFDTKEEAAQYLTDSIRGKTVGIGGSVTIGELEVYDRLCERNTVTWHTLDISYENIKKATCETRVYLTSANAIAETGEILNIDGRGNRLAATLYDKDEVYIVAGINKFAPSFEDALWRARNIAAPLNAQRLKLSTPCAKKGDKCYDCRRPDRICNALMVLWGKMLGMEKVTVVIVGEKLGY